MLNGESAFLLLKAASRSAHENSEVKMLSVMRSQYFKSSHSSLYHAGESLCFLWCCFMLIWKLQTSMKRFKENISSSRILIYGFCRVLELKLMNC